MTERKHATIIVDDVYKSFGDIKALKGVSLEAEDGKVLGLLGPNGAGKTTLVRILTSLLLPDRGQVSVAGIDAIRERDRLRHIIGLAGQYPAVDELLTGRENLEMVAQLYHFSRGEAKQRAKDLLKRFDLTEAADRIVKNYSGGMRRRLDLAASIVARPQVLFLDEPTTGLDPRTRKDLWSLIRELVADGTTLLLTTQYLEEADELADRIAVIDHGRVIAEGTASELKSSFGRDVLELQVANREKLNQAAEALRGIGDNAQLEPDSGYLYLSVNQGTQSMVEAVRALDKAEIEIADLGLRRPSLDDVFLAITGKQTSEHPVVQQH